MKNVTAWPINKILIGYCTIFQYLAIWLQIICDEISKSTALLMLYEKYSSWGSALTNYYFKTFGKIN